MTTYYHNICGKLADAVEIVINLFKGSGLTGVTIFKGGSFTTLTTPRIEILVDAEADMFGDTITGNYTANVRVRVISNCADGVRATHNGYVAVVGDALFRDDFIAQEAGATAPVADFTMDRWRPRRVAENIEGDEFVTEYQCEARCFPS